MRWNTRALLTLFLGERTDVPALLFLLPPHLLLDDAFLGLGVAISLRLDLLIVRPLRRSLNTASPGRTAGQQAYCHDPEDNPPHFPALGMTQV
jgi:hypothetical protein